MLPVARYQLSTNKLTYPMRITPRGKAYRRVKLWAKNAAGERSESEIKNKTPCDLRAIVEQVFQDELDDILADMPEGTDMGFTVWKWK